MVFFETRSTEGKRSLRRRRPIGSYLVFGLLTGVFLARCHDISNDEFLCEEAVAKLMECCGKSHPDVAALDCTYRASNGGCSPTRPNIAHATSICLLNHRCEELQQFGTCNGQSWTSQKECGTCTDSSGDGGVKTCCSMFREPICPGL
jgi:hypothetical protein